MSLDCIGIDLGTTYSCVGVFKDGRVEIIPNSDGGRTTPSWVSFVQTGDGERLVGAPAKLQAAANAANTVNDAKRIIGRSFEDTGLQNDIKRLTYKVVQDDDTKPRIVVTVQGQERKFRAEQISAMVLESLKKASETYLGGPVTKAVITVPAHFNDAQRQATKDAGAIAGLEVLRIINEPTAAALAYGLDKAQSKAGESRKVLIFDLGGGTFDVSVLAMEEGIFEVKATGGDTRLGGEDFDHSVMQFLLKEFKKKNPGAEIGDRAQRRLLAAAEKAKCTLSVTTSAEVEVESFAGGVDFQATLSRAKFESLNQKEFERCMDTVKAVLKDASTEKSQIDDVVLVGGSTRIPKIRALLSDFFGGKELCSSINPDEAVAYGAAVQGGILSGEGGAETSDLLLLDVTPLTLGIETEGGVLTKLIERNTVIPTKKTDSFTTTSDNQAVVNIAVYEGERAMVKDCHKLGQFDITNIPPASRGTPQIDVTFEIDANGILVVSALEKGTGRTEKITITNDKGRLSEEQIEKMVKEAEHYAEQDKKLRAKLNAKTAYEGYMSSARSTLGDKKRVGGKLTDDDMEAVEDALKEGSKWIRSDGAHAEAEEIEDQQKVMEGIINPIFSKLYGSGGGSGGGGEDHDDLSADDKDEL